MIAVICAIVLALTTQGAAGFGTASLAAPAPVAELAPPIVGGVVGYASPSYGPRYLAMRLPRGTHVHICGPAGCAYAVVSDYGPSKRLHPERIADLSWRDFGRVCGAHSMGLCRAQAELLEVPPELPATDTAP